MDTGGFLKSILPSEGILVGANVHGGKFKAKAFNNVNDLAAYATACAASGDVYYSMASYKQGWHKSPSGKNQLRVNSNCLYIKSLWVDIDCGDGKPYANKHAAAKALFGFIKSGGAPAPSYVIDSGGGLHAYWVLDEQLERDKWAPVAEVFKNRLLSSGVHIDPVITADAVRVLRPLGTHNHKYNPPKQVSMLSGRGTVYSLADIDLSLPDNVASDINSDLFAPEREFEPSFMEDIVKACPAMGHVRDTHGSGCLEPTWMATLQLCRFCQDGDKWVHRLSDWHPGYSYDATEEKFAQREGGGPTTCSFFASNGLGEQCGGCKHYGKIKSPISLGVRAPEPTAEPEEVVTGPAVKKLGGITYTFGNDRVTSIDDTVSPPVITVVTPYGVDGVELLYDPTMEDNYQFTLRLSTGNKKHVLKAPAKGLCDKKTFHALLLQNGLSMTENCVKHTRCMVMSWLEEIRKKNKDVIAPQSFGWADEQHITGSSFVMPEYILRPGGAELAVNSSFSGMKQFYKKEGSYDEWKKVANFIAKQNSPELVCVLLSAFASPLLKMTGINGVIMSLVSQKSGVGKTSAMQLAQAAWGHPKHGMFTPSDTINSVFKKLGVLNNIPVYWDELSQRGGAKTFVSLVRQLTGGQEKARLTSGADIRAAGSWETIMVVASNESVYDAMNKNAPGDEAGLLRVFEMEALERDINDIGATGPLFAKLNRNYGHAGDEFMRYVVNNQQRVHDAINEMYKVLDTAISFNTQERFWAWLMASLMVAAKIVNTIGIVDVDIKTVFEYLISRTNELRGEVQVNSQDPIAIFTRFLNDHLGQRLVTDKFPHTRGKFKCVVYSEPKNGALTYRYAVDDKLLCVSHSAFQQWLSKQNYYVSDVINTLKHTEGFKFTRSSIGAGVKEFNIGREMCFIVNTKEVLSYGYKKPEAEQ